MKNLCPCDMRHCSTGFVAVLRVRVSTRPVMARSSSAAVSVSAETLRRRVYNVDRLTQPASSWASASLQVAQHPRGESDGFAGGSVPDQWQDAVEVPPEEFDDLKGGMHRRLTDHHARIVRIVQAVKDDRDAGGLRIELPVETLPQSRYAADRVVIQVVPVNKRAFRPVLMCTVIRGSRAGGVKRRRSAKRVDTFPTRSGFTVSSVHPVRATSGQYKQEPLYHPVA